ncbi:MAG: Hsp20/alpha crystallin family protein [Firmicutes bacterium]|nr:Hsp20/alpha crystallin family protein [Bacillota bacterium]
MDLIRWDPRRRLARSFFDDFFDMMQGPGRVRRGWHEGGMWEPAMDVIDRKNEIVVKAELPGVEKENIKLSLTDNNLTIQGEVKKEEEIKEENYYCRERAYGSYARTLSLPSDVDRDKVKAKFKDGILEITLPKKPETQPKEITIEKG